MIVTEQTGWDEAGDWTAPWQVGDDVWLERQGMQIISTIRRIDGYGPNVVELDHGITVDLVGWELHYNEASHRGAHLRAAVEAAPPQPIVVAPPDPEQGVTLVVGSGSAWFQARLATERPYRTGEAEVEAREQRQGWGLTRLRWAIGRTLLEQAMREWDDAAAPAVRAAPAGCDCGFPDCTNP